MQDEPSDIEELFSHTREFVESKAELWKLKTVDSLSDIVSTLASRLGIILILSIFLFIISTGAALLIGEWLGKNFYGFFIIGSLYGIAGIICYINRNRWMKTSVCNMIIRELLK
jgi:hypothetical protein